TFLSYSSDTHLHIRSFPTRRSSDLQGRSMGAFSQHVPHCICGHYVCTSVTENLVRHSVRSPKHCCTAMAGPRRSDEQFRIIALRSEEHTSELQSPYDIVCRLLLEKK